MTPTRRVSCFHRAVLFVLGVLCVPYSRAAEDPLDRLEEALTTSAFNHQLRARLSGQLDLEQYHFQLPAPGVLRASGNDLSSPRLALFLDAQLGPGAYLFAQARYDRGFDPQPEHGRLRLDEYAMRLTPWSGRRLSVQLGKFATVVGNWAVRHGAWTDSFITAPLAYEQLTGVWDTDAVRSSTQLLQWSHVRPGQSAAITAIEKDRRLPILWGPCYATGAAVSGAAGQFGFAAEVKHASLSSRPETWEPSQVSWEHPTLSTRVHWQPNAMWNVGFSASTGSYLHPGAQRTLAPARGRGDYHQTVLGQDFSFAWHHWQVWAEVYAARFAIPLIGDADTLSYHAEARYKLSPQLSVALRWNEQLYGAIPDRGARTTWGRNLTRLDFAPAWRFTPHLQLKLQYSLQHGDAGPRATAHTLAAQFTVRF